MKEKLQSLSKKTLKFGILGAAIVLVGVISILIELGVINTYLSGIFIRIGVNIILAVSLNIAVGYLGQLPLGHAGFMAVGAYASAILLRSLPEGARGPLFPISIIFGGIVALIFGLIIGLPALRLKGDYLAIITLGFGEIIRVVITNIDSVLGFSFTYGAASLKNIPKLTTFFNTFLVVGIVCLLIHTLMKSKHGRAIIAVRDNEIAAESCGLNIMFYKCFGFAVSAFFAGVAGALYASFVGLLSPNTFGFMKSIEILVMVVLGGMGSMVGSVISATALTAIPEILSEFADYRMLIYSLILILVMIFGNSEKFTPLRKKFKQKLKKLSGGKAK